MSYGQVAGPDASLLTQPSRAINQALDKAGKQVGDIDLFEINEAFAAVGLASMDDLGITDEIVNVNGGAIALGHPIGMSGTRLALRCSTSSSAAAAGSVRPRCAAAAARATRCWSRACSRLVHCCFLSCATVVTTVKCDKNGWTSRLDLAATFEGPAERELVGVLEVAADRQAAGDAGDLHAERLEQAGRGTSRWPRPRCWGWCRG